MATSTPGAARVEVLPHKILFRGALHASSLNFKDGLEDDRAVATNERLLDHDELAYFMGWFPEFVATGNQEELLSPWLTSAGIVLVTCPLGELLMYLTRAVTKYLCGISNETVLPCDVLLTFTRTFFSYWSEKYNPDISPEGKSVAANCVDLLRDFVAREGNGPSLAASSVFADAEFNEAFLLDKCEDLDVFWGFDVPTMTHLSLRPPHSHRENHRGGELDCTMGKLRMVPDETALSRYLYRRYTETLLALVEGPATEGALGAEEGEDDSGGRARERTGLEEKRAEVVLARMGTELKRIAGVTPEIEFTFFNRNFRADIEAATLIDTEMSSLGKVAMYLGLYLILGNGARYRSFTLL